MKARYTLRQSGSFWTGSSCRLSEHVGAEDMAANACNALYLKNAVSRDLSPLADRARRDPKLTGDAGLDPTALFPKQLLRLAHTAVVAQLKSAPQVLF